MQKEPYWRDEMNTREQLQVADNLRADEVILWQGKPVKAPFVLAGLVFIPIGLLFFGMSIYWLFSLESFHMLSSPFTLFILFFILFGIAFMASPPILQLMRYRNTEYIITDQRLITQTGAFGLKTRFVDLDRIQEVYVHVGLIDRNFGTGSIIVSTAGGVLMAAHPTLLSLKEPYGVEKTLEEAMKRARRRQSPG